MKFIINIAVLFTLLFLAGCGGGGSSDDDNSRPDLMIFFISGHTGLVNGVTGRSYLDITAGPGIIADLRSAGYSVEFEYYIDDALRVGDYGGYQELMSDMELARDELQPKGTRSIVIAHSHGAVWAHAAINAVEALTVTALVDLDASSFGWGDVGHDAQNSFIGGDPRNRFTINQTQTCASYPNAPSDSSAAYDLEDVVSPNTQFALEVRGSQRTLVVGGDLYDEKWNVREDGNVDGLSCYYSDLPFSAHSEIHNGNGTTIAFVQSWLRDTLGD